MQDINLSEHFKLSEFTRSATATRLGIDNTIPSSLIPNLTTLCKEVLEPLREHVQQPIIIGSGYRCPALNAAVGGVKNSQHMNGEAADIHLPSIEEGRQMMLFIEDNCTFDQLLWEKESKTSNHIWIHVSCKPDISKNRQQVKSILKHA